ncbi:hypothetical protein CLV63_103308 [Murinocardiopsis flavida]|uniref:Bacterial SCP orthologue domain-containing protein n=1 Tax=Murinocardiopsis flavida TaxID=645275 RepID=A0A2P8DQT8_9ACTN|nr:sterol carrier family protein [Murinocardiopsis flavida]PSK99583.1 hypothetical protein CLV63_103308 [Murinocardiopsis flavida]
MPPKPSAAQRRRAALRAALDAQRGALGEPPYAGPEQAELTGCAEAVLRAAEAGLTPLRPAVQAAVRGTLAELAQRAPGHALEVRVPPFGAVQILAGPQHTRGTPPGVVETAPLVWLALALGHRTWAAALAAHEVTASGVRADLAPLLPLWQPRSARP